MNALKAFNTLMNFLSEFLIEKTEQMLNEDKKKLNEKLFIKTS